MNALAFLAPLPLALLLGSAVLPVGGVEVVNHSQAEVGDVRVCLVGTECQERSRLAAGERWRVTAEAGSRPLRLTVGRGSDEVQITERRRGHGVQLVLERDSRATAGRQ